MKLALMMARPLCGRAGVSRESLYLRRVTLGTVMTRFRFGMDWVECANVH